MKKLKEFIINFANLKPGNHRFDFEVNDDFFKQYEYSLVRHGVLDVSLVIEKQKETLLLFNFHLEGYIRLQCDVCLDEYDFPVDRDERLILKLEEEPTESDNDEIVFFPVEAYEIDVSSYIYEYITISLPMKSCCELAGKECNAEMLETLHKITAGHREEEKIDPRWESLKNIKKENDNSI